MLVLKQISIKEENQFENYGKAEEFIKKKKGEYPILLLDDVLSELDKKRKHKLLEEIENKVQTIITTTDLNDIESFFIGVRRLFLQRLN